MQSIYLTDILPLLNSTLVKDGHLNFAAGIFGALTLFLVVITYRNQLQKKKTFIFKKNIRSSLEAWITETLMSDSASRFIVPRNFLEIFKRPEARQLLIDELVRSKSGFVGDVSLNITRLYLQLGLNIDSTLKLTAKKPHIQCQGIHELCVMEQKNQLQKVYRLTNSKNKDVRIEAQTAILQWYGFKGLSFLDIVLYPITEFQQLKLLELLRQLNLVELPKLNKWLSSSNHTVVNFALKIAEHYKQYQVLGEAEECLSHEVEEVRVQAVKTLAVIGNASTARLLTTTYIKERFTNRLNILKHLPKIAGEDQRDFLIVQLHEGHEYLKLAAAKVLAKCTMQGMEILEAKSYEEPIPYKDIYQHVKAELLK